MVLYLVSCVLVNLRFWVMVFNSLYVVAIRLYLMHMWFNIFLLFAISHTAFYTIFRDDIFEWHADPDEEKTTKVKKSKTKEVTVVIYPKRDLLKKKRQIIKYEIDDDKPPYAWHAERYLHMFLGLVLGWVLFGILLYKHGIFCGYLSVNKFDWSDLILLVGGWIGINGRLPTIAHDVQNWFKRPS